MLRISGNRGEGKTTALLSVFAADSIGVLVVRHNAMREYIFNRWPEARFRDRDITTLANLENTVAGRGAYRLYVDELGMYELPPQFRERVIAVAGY